MDLFITVFIIYQCYLLSTGLIILFGVKILITQQLKQNALYRYSEVLKNVRADFMKQLQLKISAQDAQRIWERSLVLNYMVESHEKYMRLLRLLEKDKLALAFLKRFYEGVTTDPSVDINQFIEEAHQLMESKKFQADLMKLDHKSNILAIAGLLGSLLLWTTGYILIVTLPSLVLVPVSGLMMIAGATLLLLCLATRDARLEIKKVNNSMLQNKEEPLYQLNDIYSYDTVDATDKCLISTEIKRSFQPRSKSQLRDCFFQPDGWVEPLSRRVRREFAETLFASKI